MKIYHFQFTLTKGIIKEMLVIASQMFYLWTEGNFVDSLWNEHGWGFKMKIDFLFNTWPPHHPAITKQP